MSDIEANEEYFEKELGEYLDPGRKKFEDLIVFFKIKSSLCVKNYKSPENLDYNEVRNLVQFGDPKDNAIAILYSFLDTNKWFENYEPWLYTWHEFNNDDNIPDNVYFYSREPIPWYSGTEGELLDNNLLFHMYNTKDDEYWQPPGKSLWANYEPPKIYRKYAVLPVFRKMRIKMTEDMNTTKVQPLDYDMLPNNNATIKNDFVENILQSRPKSKSKVEKTQSSSSSSSSSSHIAKVPVPLKNSPVECIRKTKKGSPCKCKLLVLTTPYCLKHAKSEYNKIKNMYPALHTFDLDNIDPNSDVEVVSQVPVVAQKITIDEFLNRFNNFSQNCLLYDTTNKKYRIKPRILYRVFIQYMKDIGYPIEITEVSFFKMFRSTTLIKNMPIKGNSGQNYLSNICFNPAATQYYYNIIMAPLN